MECAASLSAWWWVSFGAEGERGLLQKVLKLFSLPPFSESEEVEEVGGGETVETGGEDPCRSQELVEN